MTENKRSDRSFWSPIEISRKEYFLLLIEKMEMSPSVFLQKWEGVTVTELAELLGVETSKIYHWRSKKNKVSQYYLLKTYLLDLFLDYFEEIPDCIWEKFLKD